MEKEKFQIYMRTHLNALLGCSYPNLSCMMDQMIVILVQMKEKMWM